MSDNNDSKVIIKLEIQVPLGAGQAPVVIQYTPASTTPPVVAPVARTMAMHGDAAARDPANVNARVRVAGSGATTGDICVTASDDQDELGRIPVDVKAAILVPGNDIPGAPPLGTPLVTPLPDSLGNLTYLNWWIAQLGTANCAWSGSGTGLPFNELVIWRLYENEGFWTIEIIAFRGICTTVTDCEYDSAVQASLGRLETTTQAWQIKCEGFGSGFAAFNGVWELPRSTSTKSGRVSWLAGGDGVSQPQMEMRADECGCEPLELRLSLGGNRIVYRLPRADLNPLGGNCFRWGNDVGHPAGVRFPTELTAVPAG